MDVDLFDFELPEENIALRPLPQREQAKLLYVAKDSSLKDLHVGDLESLLTEDDAVVFNDTKVIPARLEGVRYRGEARANISVTLHLRVSAGSWKVFLRPAKRLKLGERIIFSKGDCQLEAVVEKKSDDGEVLLSFNKKAAELDLAIATLGYMPLPPYIASKRHEDEQDKIDYQTIFARKDGAVAAPTAGLHFTSELMKKIEAKGVKIFFVTLHVGAGTFLPVKVDDTKDHKMHEEIGFIDQQTADGLNAVKKKGGHIVSIGTTPLRLLESATDEEGRLQAWTGGTNIFITPGYKFRFVDRLMTNFHLPRSTLFMLVSAFCGLKTIKNAYTHAIDNQYRFYSYGDASFLERND